jgi:hypothetical protein
MTSVPRTQASPTQTPLPDADSGGPNEFFRIASTLGGFHSRMEDGMDIRRVTRQPGDPDDISPEGRTPILTWGLLSALGLVCIIGGMIFGSLSGTELLYDIGIGVLLATGVSVAVTRFLQRIADRERVARERLEKQVAAEQRAREEALSNIKAVVDEIGAGLAHLTTDTKVVLLGEQLFQTDMKIESLHEDVRMIRIRVDPRYVHPNAAEVDRVMDKLRKTIDDSA